MNKKGKLTNKTINIVAISIVVLIVFLSFYSALIPQVQSSGNQLNSSGVPLGGLFTDRGLVIILIMAAAFMVVILPFIKEKISK